MRLEASLKAYSLIVDLVGVGRINSKDLFDLVKEQTKYSEAKVFRLIKKLVKVGILTKTNYRNGTIEVDSVFAKSLDYYEELSTQALIVQYLVNTNRMGVMF